MIRFLIAVCFLGLTGIGLASAQNLTLSPYSRYGVGDIFPSTTSRNMGMGNVGIATQNFASVNRSNPASFADIYFTTLDFSGFSQLSNFKSVQDKEQQFSAGFHDLSFAFPSNNNLVLAFGFSPYSAVGYDIITNYEVEIRDSMETVGNQYNAEGGLNQAFLGMATTFFDKKLKVGATAFYSFGNTKYQWVSAVATQSLNTYTDVQIERATFISGGGLQGGIIFADTISGRKPKDPKKEPAPLVMYRIGASVDYHFDLKGDRLTTFSNRIVTDTIGEVEIGTVVLPPRYGLGFSIVSPGRWELSAEGTYRRWSNFRYFSDDIQTGDSYRIAVGGEWTPDIDANSFLKRLAFRMGLAHQRVFLNYDINAINDNAVSFGLGIPASRKGTSFFNRERGFSQVHIGASIGKRGSLKEGFPLEELYFRFRLGVTINERWFRQYKID